ncbi:uncharacterized protein LOC113291942 [Papaver somniferum]|uniref:uncharacterized protein LOC113291942 n=1 Tax=Papaver somniferum TaxID=3469 RepID=UPI000E6F60AC|nr:uncharacterized protein LOC113291942 [Papaver somniferum]
MRHLGYIRRSPDDDYVPPFKHKLDKCKGDGKTMIIVYEPKPEAKHSNDRHKGKSMVDISFWEHVNEGHEVSEDYMPWYEGFSHPRVIRIDTTTGKRSNKASSSASTSDTRDDSTILKLVRERMKILIKEFCCLDEKGEVIKPERHRKYTDYYKHIENPQAEKMFADLSKGSKRTRKTSSQLRQERAERVKE